MQLHDGMQLGGGGAVAAAVAVVVVVAAVAAPAAVVVQVVVVVVLVGSPYDVTWMGSVDDGGMCGGGGGCCCSCVLSPHPLCSPLLDTLNPLGPGVRWVGPQGRASGQGGANP